MIVGVVQGYKLTKQGRSSFMDKYVHHHMSEEEKRLHPTRTCYRLEGYLDVPFPYCLALQGHDAEPRVHRRGIRMRTWTPWPCAKAGSP